MYISSGFIGTYCDDWFIVSNSIDDSCFGDFCDNFIVSKCIESGFIGTFCDTVS